MIESYLRIGDAARILSVSSDTMRRWAEEGIITAYRSPGGQVKFRERDVRELLTRRDDPKRAKRRLEPQVAPLASDDADERSRQMIPKWKELPPWEQRRAQVETEIAIERLEAARQNELADEDRMARVEFERTAENARLTELKRLGRASCWLNEAAPEVIRELERFVTSDQFPPWLPQWEAAFMLQRFVWAICERERDAREASGKP